MNSALPGQTSLIHVPDLQSIPPPTTRRRPGAALTRYPSAHRASLEHARFRLRAWGSGLRHLPADSPPRQAESSSLCVADWAFTSRCSPPRLAATQFPSVTGRRTFARRGLSPRRSGTLSDPCHREADPLATIRRYTRRVTERRSLCRRRPGAVDMGCCDPGP